MGLKDPFRVLILICTMKLNRLFLVSVPALCLAFSFCSSGSRKADDDIPLPASVDVPHVAEGDYADMSRPNLTFTADKIVCNYLVESYVYVIDRRSGQTNVFEAPSRLRPIRPSLAVRVPIIPSGNATAWKIHISMN